MPQRELEALAAALERPRGSVAVDGAEVALRPRRVRAALLRECVSREALADPRRLAAAIRALPLRLAAPRPLAEAISTAGGVRFDALDAQLMHGRCPVCSAPARCSTGRRLPAAYLLTGCFATGVAAAEGAASWLALEQGTRGAVHDDRAAIGSACRTDGRPPRAAPLRAGSQFASMAAVLERG